jgi:hypothetical protein
MKRSSSLVSSKTPKEFRRAFTWNEAGAYRPADSRATVGPVHLEHNRHDEWLVGSPISRTGIKVNPKILTSDLWSNAMRAKLRKFNENYLLSGKSVKDFKKYKKFDLPALESRFKRSNTDKNLEIFKGNARNFKIKPSEKIPTVKSLEEIIDECIFETKDNRKMMNDMKIRKKVIEQDFQQVKRIIKLE